MDRNKTELTQNITRLAALWLDGKGFKPVETEISVAPQWVADVAGVCCPTQTEMINLKLIKPPPRSRDFRDPTYQLYGEKYAAWREQYEGMPRQLTALIEVKTSVGDYRGDSKWTRDWPTDLCYVAMPEGMIPPERWPKGWGVILFSKNGTTVRRTFPSELRPSNFEQRFHVVHNLAVSRDHKTRYERMRQFEKQVRIRQGEEKTLHRIRNVISFVRAITRGTPVERAARSYGIRTRLPEYMVRDLETLCPAAYVTRDRCESATEQFPVAADNPLPSPTASDHSIAHA